MKYIPLISDIVELKECSDLRSRIRLSLLKVNTVKYGKTSLLHVAAMLWKSLTMT